MEEQQANRKHGIATISCAYLCTFDYFICSHFFPFSPQSEYPCLSLALSTRPSLRKGQATHHSFLTRSKEGDPPFLSLHVKAFPLTLTSPLPSPPRSTANLLSSCRGLPPDARSAQQLSQGCRFRLMSIRQGPSHLLLLLLLMHLLLHSSAPIQQHRFPICHCFRRSRGTGAVGCFVIPVAFSVTPTGSVRLLSSARGWAFLDVVIGGWLFAPLCRSELSVRGLRATIVVLDGTGPALDREGRWGYVKGWGVEGKEGAWC